MGTYLPPSMHSSHFKHDSSWSTAKICLLRPLLDYRRATGISLLESHWPLGPLDSQRRPGMHAGRQRGLLERDSAPLPSWHMRVCVSYVWPVRAVGGVG